MARIGILLRIALANLVSSFLNLFVGSILAFGAALLVVGGSLFATLDQSLSRSIVGSITGHLQVYAARSKNALEVYGKVDGSDAVLAPMDDFKRLKARLLELPNVAQVVPMGACTVLLSSGNTVDLALERLRGLYRATSKGFANPSEEAEFRRKTESQKAHVRNMVSVLVKDAERASEMMREDSADRSREALATAASAEFWQTFDDDPMGHLELLENKVAPEVGDSDLLFARVLGTDLHAYQRTFDRLAIVEGTPVPEGHKGVLMPRFYLEELLKLKNARRLDKIREGRAVGRTIAGDKELQRLVRENQGQTREVVLQLDGAQTADAIRLLQEHLGSKEAELPALLSAFFATDDLTFDARYRFFYDSLAPMLTLYRAKVGDDITLRSFGRSGGVESASVKIYGVFEMRGLEKSPLAGLNILVDMVTFRELYGYLSAERKAELDAIRAATGVTGVSRETAEAELFGGDAPLEQRVEAAPLGEVPALRQGRTTSATYDPAEIDEGVVLHAAIMLKDGSDLARNATQTAVEKLVAEGQAEPSTAIVAAAQQRLDRGDLPFAVAAPLQKALAGSGPERFAPAAVRELDAALRSARRTMTSEDADTIERLVLATRPSTWVVDWVTAASYLGQFISFFKLLLFGMVVAFAFIALIVVTIGVTIATLQRTQTIGTMRAIGAQREWVLGMVLTETVVLSLVFGTLGVLVGVGVVGVLNSVGIPAFRDELYFFFSGPVLRPTVTAGSVLLSMVATMVVSLLAVLFPLGLALRVSPIVAMQSAE